MKGRREQIHAQFRKPHRRDLVSRALTMDEVREIAKLYLARSRATWSIRAERPRSLSGAQPLDREGLLARLRCPIPKRQIDQEGQTSDHKRVEGGP